MSERRGLDLSATQLIAGGLATGTAAVAASFLGVAGTVIGTALMSIVTTAGAAVYKHYLDRGRERYVTLVSESKRGTVLSRAEARAAPETTVLRVNQDTGAVTQVINDTDETVVLRTLDGSAPARSLPKITPERQRRRPRWYVMAAAAVAIFAVVMGGVTLVEALANKPLSAMLGGPVRSGTSLGRTFGGGAATSPAPAVTPTTPTPTPSTTQPGGSTGPATPATPPPTAPVRPTTPPPATSTAPTPAPTSGAATPRSTP